MRNFSFYSDQIRVVSSSLPSSSSPNSIVLYVSKLGNTEILILISKKQPRERGWVELSGQLHPLKLKLTVTMKAVKSGMEMLLLFFLISVFILFILYLYCSIFITFEKHHNIIVLNVKMIFDLTDSRTSSWYISHVWKGHLRCYTGFSEYLYLLICW